MFDLLRKTALAAVAATALMMTGGTSEAASVNPLSNIGHGGTYDMLGGGFFYGEAFIATDGAGFRDFTFENNHATAQNLMLTTATVNALAGMFTGGIKFQWLTSGLFMNVTQATMISAFSLDNLIAANSDDTLRITFGDPANRGAATGNPGFTVNLVAFPVPIPLPAGGLLLIGALGGLAALRRRKMAA